MKSSNTLSYQASHMADSAYKKYEAFPIGGLKDAQDAEDFFNLTKQMTVTNALFTENLRIEHHSLKTAIESFQ